MRAAVLLLLGAAACATGKGSTSPSPAARESAMKEMGVRPASLTGATWEWIGTQTPVELIRPDDPARYTLRFGADGTVTGAADCNRLNGTYTVSDKALQFGPLATTRMLCPPGSQGEWFVKNLGYVRHHFFTGADTLRLDMMADGGTFAFRRAR